MNIIKIAEEYVGEVIVLLHGSTEISAEEAEACLLAGGSIRALGEDVQVSPGEWHQSGVDFFYREDGLWAESLYVRTTDQFGSFIYGRDDDHLVMIK